MRRTLLRIIGIWLSFSATQAGAASDDEPSIISYYSVMDRKALDFNEASFSVPKPIVVIDPLAFEGADAQNRTTIQQTGVNQIKIRIKGTVFDFIADMVADHKADIRQIRINNAGGGTLATLPLTLVDGDASHPFESEFAQAPGLSESIRPYAFAGRFDSGDIILTIQNGYNGLYVEAVNVNGGDAISIVEIKARFNREEQRYDLKSELNNRIDPNLYNPVLVYIDDPSITPENVDKAHATINGARVGLRFVNGQLQLDRPIMGLNSTPPDEIPNLVNVTGDPDSFVIEYENYRSEFTWSYTAY